MQLKIRQETQTQTAQAKKFDTKEQAEQWVSFQKENDQNFQFGGYLSAPDGVWVKFKS